MKPTAARYLATAIFLTCLAACGRDAVDLGSKSPGSGTSRSEESTEVAPDETPAAHEILDAWRDFAPNYNEPDPRQSEDLAGVLGVTDVVVVARATMLRPFYSIPMGPGTQPARTSTLTLEVETIVAGALVHERHGTIQVTVPVGFLADPLPPRNLGGQHVVALLRDREAETRGRQDEHPERYAGQYGFTSGQGLFVESDRGLVTPLWEPGAVPGAATDSITHLVDSIEAALPADFSLPVDQRSQ